MYFFIYKESKSIFNTLKYLIFVYFYLIYSIKYIKCLNVEKKNQEKMYNKIIQCNWIKKILIIPSGCWIAVMIEFPHSHFYLAVGTVEGIYSKSYVHLALIEGKFRL